MIKCIYSLFFIAHAKSTTARTIRLELNVITIFLERSKMNKNLCIENRKFLPALKLIIQLGSPL
jgi:hypothetical protein